MPRAIQRCLFCVLVIVSLTGSCWLTLKKCPPDDSLETAFRDIHDHCAGGSLIGRYIYLGPQDQYGLGYLLRKKEDGTYFSPTSLKYIAPAQYSEFARDSKVPAACTIKSIHGIDAAINADAALSNGKLDVNLEANDLVDGSLSVKQLYVDTMDNVDPAQDLILNYALAKTSGGDSALLKDLKGNGVTLITTVERIRGLSATYSFKAGISTKDQLTIHAKAGDISPNLKASFSNDRTMELSSDGDFRIAVAGITMRIMPEGAYISQASGAHGKLLSSSGYRVRKFHHYFIMSKAAIFKNHAKLVTR